MVKTRKAWRKTRKHGGVRFAKNFRPTNKPVATAVYGRNMPNIPSNLNTALHESRKRGPTSRPTLPPPPPLQPANAKILANLWAAYNNPSNMFNALEETNLNEEGKDRVLNRLMYLSEDLA